MPKSNVAAKLRADLNKEEKERNKLRCSKCNSRNIYTKINGIKVCRLCGHKGK